MDFKKIVLIGGGGHCVSVIDVIERQGEFTIAGIVDQNTSDLSVLGYPVIGSDSDLPSICALHTYFCITVGQIKSAGTRVRLYNEIKSLGGTFPVIVSPTAYVSKHAELGEGTVVHHQSVVNAGARIGYNCIINSFSNIEHDVELGNHVHISTGAMINGGATIGDHVFVGSNSVVLQQIAIHADVIIGAGTLVNRNIIDAGVYFGNPLNKKIHE